jgi:hypothetical protein
LALRGHFRLCAREQYLDRHRSLSLRATSDPRAGLELLPELDRDARRRREARSKPSRRSRFADLADTELSPLLSQVYEFRNTYMAHQKKELTDRDEAEGALREWIQLILRLHEAAAREPLAGTA